MRGPSRSGILALVAWSVAGAVGCAPSAEVRGCATSAGCPLDARCVSSACVANAPPSVAIALPASPQANALLSFDASASADPDPGDAIVSFSWTFRALSGEPCAPPAVAGTGPVVPVRFGCPGRYAVDVTATDRMGASATATRELDVAPLDGPALVTVGGDVAVDHVCTPTPWCTTVAPAALQAATPGLPADQVTFAWTVVPPADRPLSSSRRVSFSPSAAAASPQVAIETDGEAISGDWVFQVEARDAAGVIGTAATRVSVLNRPPVVTKTIPSPDHAFDGAQLTASGEVAYTVTDPDGDPLRDPAVEWRHSGDGGSTFSGVLLSAPARATFAIAVAYAAPADAEHLIGGAGLERTILFGVSDANGGTTAESWPIVVRNRPPALVSAPAALTVDHRYDPVGLAYVADAPLSTWADPDGDPLWQVPGSDTGDPECPQLDLVAGVAHARCRLPFTGTPAAGNLAGLHSVSQTVQDPWVAAASTSTVSFSIGNRAPAITSTAVHVVAEACGPPLTCCSMSGLECIEFSAMASAGSSVVPSRWADPDGDPLDVHVGAEGTITPVQPLVCTPSTCALQLGLAEYKACGLFTTALPVTITDGLDSASGTLPVERGCL
ncbi:MAG TPA: PKD domain-containing protein [Anaeromyxobacter sp.]